jgi:nitroimidazol reductase NimA-like FMN-containing flavoprotein (pyridoxamine 5'-phosphate oxidase superfamily)
MQLVDPRTGIEMLDRDACLKLLAGDTVGRLGVITHGAPRIFPVNYALDGDAVVLRTAHGTKLDAGVRSPACFEIDTFDRESRTGWSVLVVGHLEEVTPLQHRAWERVNALPLAPWAPYEKEHFLRLVPEHIGGRRIG